MKIFIDVFTSDEVMSDSFPFCMAFDGLAMEIRAKYVFQNDFFGDSQSLAQKDQEKVIDIVNVFAYKQLKIDENLLMKRLQIYSKKVHEYLEKNKPERIEGFQKGMENMLGWIKENYQDLLFYRTPQNQNEGLVVISYMKQGNPIFLVIADGLKEEKI